MLLRITVLQYKGAPPPAALAYMFDERGGSIGREGCDLTLPDETRVLSRVQARIVFSDGLFSLLDQGGNPSIVNSLRVGKGLTRPLYDGDIIELCDYKLRVKAIGAAVASGTATNPPMRAIDPFPQDLVPPILLDPDELTGAPIDVPVIRTDDVAEIKESDASEDGEDDPEMTFDMDVDFDSPHEDAPAIAHDAIAPAVTAANQHVSAPDPASASTARQAAAEQVPAAADQSEAARAITALCLGLGIPLPPDATTLPPQHVGIIIRRAMQRTLVNVLQGIAPAHPDQDRAVMSHDAESNFHSLLRSEFLAACEAQINRLREHN